MRGRLLFMLLLLVQRQSWAEPIPSVDHEAPSKTSVEQSLLPYWEETIKHDPGTRLFEKTSESGVYRIQTTVVPYTGRVKVLNIVVDVYKPVGIYDSRVTFGGVVETELMDAPKDMAINHRFSFQKWQRMGWFDYDSATSKWFPFSNWDQRRARVKLRRLTGIPNLPRPTTGLVQAG
jgi:hypothetical protein